MADDNDRSNLDPSGEHPTLKFNALRVSPAEVEATVEEFIPDVDVLPLHENEGQDEATAMLDRRELLQMTRKDSSHHRLNKPTRQLSAESTAQMNTTEIRNHITKSKAHTADPEETVEQTRITTREVTRASIGTIDHDRGTLEFPARLLPDDTLPIPATLARELGIEPGDLIVVTIQKLT